MNSNTFVERYFHSQDEMVDIRVKEQRDINSLFTYLENLHSLSDKMKSKFNTMIAIYPEFKLLRIIRNYFHHVNDVNEIRMFVNIQPDVSPYHIEHIIIPRRVWAEAVSGFIDKNTVPITDKRFATRQRYIDKEIDSILNICDCVDILRNPKSFCQPLLLSCDGVVIELGFDLFKFVYNISNIIADTCRNIPELASKKVINDLDEGYRKDNNIPKYDLMINSGAKCILTTQGYIFPNTIEKTI